MSKWEWFSSTVKEVRLWIWILVFGKRWIMSPGSWPNWCLSFILQSESVVERRNFVD